MEKISPNIFLFLSCLVLAVSICFVPFAPHIVVMAAAVAVAELALGLIDTGANVVCLQIWKDKSGPFFNALHLCQSIGFLLAPVFAATVLSGMNYYNHISLFYYIVYV